MKVKGLGLKNTVVALEKLHGKEGLERVKEAMSARIRDTIAQALPLEWYPAEVNAALHVAIRDTLGGGSWKESHRVSREAARVEATGVYRLVLRAVQYDTVWDRMERMWPYYYDAGEVRWIERGHGHALGEFRGVAGFNEGMWLSIAGRIEILLELAGARGTAVTVLDPGSTHATIEALWLE